LAPGVTESDGVRVHRLKAFFTLGQIVVAFGVLAAVKSTAPDLVVVIGLGKRFPKPVFKAGFRTLTLLGDNEFSYVRSSGLAKIKSKALFALFKKSTYQAAIRKSDHLVAYTPESFEAAAAVLGGDEAQVLRNLNAQVSLGFWPEDFFFSPELRAWKRASMGFAEGQKVVITASRITPEKDLEKAMALFAQLPADCYWLVVGSDGGAYAKKFEEDGKRTLGSHRFSVMPYQPRPLLNSLYNVADVALYTVPAISIFEAVGAGLPCALPRENSLSHILDGAEGFYFNDLTAQETALGFDGFDLAEGARFERMFKARKHYSWMAVAESVLGTVKDEQRRP
jgi:glycosyltransferase involved in cell wall biosynthesis